MPSSISGNAGTPNAKVTWVNSGITATGSVTSDGSGNYTISGLADDTYTLIAYLPNFTFSPSSGLTVVISGSNVTGQDFTAASVTPVSYSYTKVGSDTFTQADGPLNPAKWTTLGGYAPLAVVSNKCVGTAPFPSTSSDIYSGAACPANVYAQIQVDALAADSLSVAEIDVRENVAATVYSKLIIVQNSDNTVQLIAIGSDGMNGITIFSLPWTPGDVFRVEFYGTAVSVYQNGTLIGNGICDGVIGGTQADLLLTPQSSAADVQVSNFEFGSITASGGAVGWSPVDSRNFATFPNTGVVQSDGSVFYTGQTSSNSTVPGTDSRASGAPVDSRVNKPVNSRVNPNP